MSSPRPVGLGLRSTPDAVVIAFSPHRARLRAPHVVGASALCGLLYVAARAAVGPAIGWWLGGAWLLACAVVGIAWWREQRRAAQRVELYVGQARWVAVFTADGEERARHEGAWIDVEQVVADDRGVWLRGEAGAWQVPMAGEDAEARAWMVEHLSAAALRAHRHGANP